MPPAAASMEEQKLHRLCTCCSPHSHFTLSQTLAVPTPLCCFVCVEQLWNAMETECRGYRQLHSFWPGREILGCNPRCISSYATVHCGADDCHAGSLRLCVPLPFRR